MNILKSFINEVLKETISLPPRNVKKYYEIIVPSKIKKYTIARENLKKSLSNISKDLSWDFIGDTFYDINFQDIEILLEKIDILYYLEGSLIDTFKQIKERWVINHILEFAERTLENWRFNRSVEISNLILNNKEKIIETTEEYQEFAIKYYDENFPSNLPNLLFAYAKATLVLEQELNNLIPKTKEVLRYKGDGPEHESVESLYHASVNAKELYENGFAKNIPQEGGLGGSQSLSSIEDKGISFTADLYIAKEIARSLKEVIGIANKKYDFRNVLTWALQDGVSEEELMSEYRLKKRAKEKPSLSSPKEVFELYRRYLTFAESKGNRYNPLYFGVSINSFKNLKEENVGVIKVKIDMTNPDMQYFSGMHEFRVPLKSVIEIEKLIQ